jgi:hypothetical protein
VQSQARTVRTGHHRAGEPHLHLHLHLLFLNKALTLSDGAWRSPGGCPMWQECGANSALSGFAMESGLTAAQGLRGRGASRARAA